MDVDEDDDFYATEDNAPAETATPKAAEAVKPETEQADEDLEEGEEEDEADDGSDDSVRMKWINVVLDSFWIGHRYHHREERWCQACTTSVIASRTSSLSTTDYCQTASTIQRDT